MALLAEFRALDKRLWYLAGARLVVTGGFSMVMPFLGIHLAEERKVPTIVVGLIWTVAGACGAAMQWLAGELADRFGRRPLMLASLLIRAVNLSLMGYAVSVEASVIAFGALIVANSMLRACFDPVGNALVADLAPPEQRVAAFSLQRVGVNVGWATGPAVAAMASGHSYSQLFYWSVPVTLAAAAVIATMAEPRSVASARPLRLKEMLAFTDDKVFVRFLVSTMAFFILQVQLYQTLSIYAVRVLHLTRAQIGTLYTLNGVLVVCLQLPAVAYIRRWGTRGALTLGCCGYAISYAAAGLTQGYASLLVCVGAVTLAEIITSPAQQTSVAALAPLGRVGAYSGLYGLAQIVGQSTGPLIGTAALDALPARATWFFLALFGVAAAVGYRPAARTARGTGA